MSGERKQAQRRPSSYLTVALTVAAAVASAAQVLHVPAWNSWPARVAVLVAVAGAAAVDLKRGTVPPLVTQPLLAGAAVQAAISLNLAGLGTLGIALWDVRVKSRTLEMAIHALLVPVAFATGAAFGGGEAHLLTTLLWLLTYRMWRANWMGGGDGMLLMGLVGLYPTSTLALALALGWLVVGLAWMAWLYRRSFVAGLFHALAVIAAPPKISRREDLEQQGVPMAAAFAAGFLFYLVYLLLSGR